MSFSVHSCLAAEDVRPEAGERATIIGFMGIAPFPTIMIPDIGHSTTRISFMFVIQGEGEYVFGAEIRVSESKEVVYKTSALTATMVSSQILNVIFGPLDISFPSYGSFEILLVVNSAEYVSYPFTLRKP